MNITHAVWGTTIALSLWVMSVSCTHTPVKRGRLLGTLVRVDQPEGAYFSPAKGERPLTFLCVEVENKDADNRPRFLKITLFDLYSREQYGKEGDKISFIPPGKIPLSGHLVFSDLVSYKVEHAPQ